MKKTVLVTQLFLFLFIPPVLNADFNRDNKIFRKEMLQGNISFGKGNYHHALKHFKKARSIRNSSSLLKKQTAFSNSKDGWDFWLSLVPYQLYAPLRGWVAIGIGSAPMAITQSMAIKDFQSALDINPENHWVLFSKGNVNYYHLNKKNQGVIEMKKAAGLGNPSAREILKNIK